MGLVHFTALHLIQQCWGFSAMPQSWTQQCFDCNCPVHRRPVVAADLPTIRALNQVNDATFDSCLHDTSDFLIVATVQGHIVGFVRWVQGHCACGFFFFSLYVGLLPKASQEHRVSLGT